MKKCHECNATMKIVSKPFDNPMRDVFKCPKCGAESYRYENTKYEQPGDPRH